MSEYSSRSLSEKLGLKADTTVVFLNMPAQILKTLKPFPSNMRIKQRLTGTVEYIHFFITTEVELRRWFPTLCQHLAKNGLLWISWPKKSAKMVTDLDENMIRDIGLTHGVVDVKVVAIDETWSGLKFVYRLKDRPIPE